MNILAIDCSSSSLSVCIEKDDHILYSIYLDTTKTHSETLMPNIEYALAKSKININDIDVYGVTVGPGSYTGLRIGVSTVKALAQVANKSVASISSLKALAVQALPSSKYICPVLDARNDQIYSGLYKYDHYILSPVMEDAAYDIDGLIKELQKLDLNEDIVFIGNGSLLHSTKIKKALGNKAMIMSETYSVIDAKNVALLTKVDALNEELVNYLDLEPVYLRKSQAERELESKS